MRSRDNAAIPRAEPSAPMRAAHVADVRHRCAAVLRRAGHAPARHHELALAVVAGAHDRRHLIGEDARKEREVARAVMPGTKPIADRRLAFGQAVEVAHAAEVCSHKAKSQRRQEPMPRLTEAPIELESAAREASRCVELWRAQSS
jgi:hypothetical protein